MPSRVSPAGWAKRGLIAALSLTLASCVSTERPGTPPIVKRPAGPVPDVPVKIGRPYQVGGVWYYPADDRAYDEGGMASWYGGRFHTGAPPMARPMTWIASARPIRRCRCRAMSR